MKKYGETNQPVKQNGIKREKQGTCLDKITENPNFQLTKHVWY